MTKHIILSYTAVILWMILIFNLSSQVAEQSNQLSTGLTEIIVNTLEKVAPNISLDMMSFNHILRKNAHFFAYLILGILVSNAVTKSKGISFWVTIGIAMVICIFYAISDEVHQLFVKGRGSQVTDVIIDSMGAGVGIFLHWLICRWDKRI